MSNGDAPQSGSIWVLTTESVLERRLERLTEAERAVAMMMLDGRSNAEIAAARGTSERTVHGQVLDIFSLYRVNSRAELAWALEGPDEPPPVGSRRVPRRR